MQTIWGSKTKYKTPTWKDGQLDIRYPKNQPRPIRRKTKSGSQIIRECNGQTYILQVTDKGFVMAGVTYKSLSAAAKAITGAHWSGPRFFGVEA